MKKINAEHHQALSNKLALFLIFKNFNFLQDAMNKYKSKAVVKIPTGIHSLLIIQKKCCEDDQPKHLWVKALKFGKNLLSSKKRIYRNIIQCGCPYFGSA